MIQWRALFDQLGIKWKDRGRNCAKGRVNINCPYCWDDPSEHCTISEETGRWYCFRDQSHHGDAAMLVTKLLESERRPRIQALALLDDYDEQTPPTQRIEEPPRKLSNWQRFQSASENNQMLDYLWGRGFDDPAKTCRNFDLRYARNGEWAQRLLIPLYDQHGEQVGWTGRALRESMEPRYRAEPAGELINLIAGSLIGSHLLVVEGAIDALKFNSAVHADLQTISCCGLTGLHLSAPRIMAICSRRRRALSLALDATVPLHLKRRIAAELSVWSLERMTRHLSIPSGYEDIGAMPESEVRAWGGALLTDAVRMAGSLRELG